MADNLRDELVERVLDRLGLSSRPELSLAGLSDLYGAWCRRVPFDNIRKLIHVRAGNPTTLPGDMPNEFFEAWLQHGTGATCWAGNAEPLPVLEGARIPHPAWGVDARFVDGFFTVRWNALQRPDPLDCRFNIYDEEIADLVPNDIPMPLPPDREPPPTADL